MENAVDVCIVITNQNQGLFLERCIRSCLAQTFPGRFHEVLVVDAGSSDFSREVIRSYGNKIVPILMDDAHDGLEEATCAGIRRSKGRYVLQIRAQDFISDYMILFQAIWLYQNPKHDGVSVDCWMVDHETDAKVKRICGLTSCYGTMYRKEVLVKEGLYEAQVKDWTPERLQKRLDGRYEIGHLPIPFYRYQQEQQLTDTASPLDSPSHRRR